MIEIFLTFFWITFAVVRLGTEFFHDFETYSKSEPWTSQARTITGILRRKTGFDWHHIHVGFIFLLITAPLIFLFGLTLNLTISLAIGLSLVSDQILPWLNSKNYFNKKMFIGSVIIHLIISMIYIRLS